MKRICVDIEKKVLSAVYYILQRWWIHSTAVTTTVRLVHLLPLPTGERRRSGAVRCPILKTLVAKCVLVDLHEAQDKVEEDRPSFVNKHTTVTVL